MPRGVSCLLPLEHFNNTVCISANICILEFNHSRIVAFLVLVQYAHCLGYQFCEW